MDAIENMENLMSERTFPNWPVIPVLLAVAACAPRAGESPNPRSIATATEVAQPPLTAPDGDCGSASVYESRRGGNIDCFYAWNQGLAACVRGS